MKILAIETSCDETGIALLEGLQIRNGFSFTVLKNSLLSQAKLHAQYGGVYPNLAKREHTKNLPVLFEEFKDEPFDAIAVTNGPGLEPALWTGIEFAKKIALEKNLPLLPINHMEGHIVSSLAQEEHSHKLENVRMFTLHEVRFPVLALLISGGHTEFVLMKEWFSYEIIGQTLDDAAGEAFDKVARMLELAYPGGPEISKLADAHRKEGGGKSAIPLPRPMLQSNSCDVSFSGLKTAALYSLRGRNLSDEEKKAFAREFEDAVTDVFITKTERALAETNAATFVIGGGVAANRFIRESLQSYIAKEFPEVELRLPEVSITGDNAIMIAQAALARALSGISDSKKEDIRAIGNLSLSPKK